METSMDNIKSKELKDVSVKLIRACIEKQCSIGEDREDILIDMYTGEQFSRKKMILFLSELDVDKNRKPDSIVLFYDYIADHFPEQAPYCMARIISTCRKMNEPKRGISRSYYYFKKYDVEVCSSEMFVSLSAALKDIGNLKLADQCASLAMKFDFNNINTEYIENLCFNLAQYK